MPVLAAYADGKSIQHRARRSACEWLETRNLACLDDTLEYRIKPEPKVRPWTVDTVPPMPVQVRWKGIQHRTFIAAANEHVIWLGGAHSGISYEEALKSLELIDGSPCGTTEPA